MIVFLFLIAPGIVFEGIQERRRPSIEQTTLREASRIALAGLLFSAVALLVLSVVGALAPGWMPQPGRWLSEGARYVQGSYFVVARFLLVQLCLALGLAALVARLLGGSQPAGMRRLSAWHLAFRVRRERNAQVFLRVTQTDGVEYQGMLIGYTTQYKIGDRELQLGPPLYRRSPDDAEPTRMPAVWKRLIIPATAIKDILVSYLVSPAHSTQHLSEETTGAEGRRTHATDESTDERVRTG